MRRYSSSVRALALRASRAMPRNTATVRFTVAGDARL